MNTSSCVSTCGSGSKWRHADPVAYDTIESQVGECVSCSAGTYSVAENEWIELCQALYLPGLHCSHTVLPISTPFVLDPTGQTWQVLEPFVTE